MSIPAAGFYPGYATPRFCVDHLIRDEGIGALSGWTAATDFPLDRMIDQQIGSVAKHNAAAATTLKLTRAIASASPNQVAFDRVVIYGSNFHGNYAAIRLEVSDNDAAWHACDTTINGIAGGPAEYDLAPPGIVDWQLDVPYANRYVRMQIDAGKAGYTAPEIGEFWITRTLQPAAGTAHQWTNGVLPAVSQTETRARLVTSTIEGAERAKYAAGWKSLPEGDDLELLRYVARKAGIRRNILLYEHAGFGNQPAVINDMDANTEPFILSASTIQGDGIGGGPSGGDMQSLSGTTGPRDYWGTDAPGQTPIPVGTGLDYSDAIIEVWINGTAVAANVADMVDDLEIILLSGNGSDADSNAGTAYKLGGVIAVQDLTSHWYKMALDPSTWNDTKVYTEVAGYDGPVDLRKVSLFVYRCHTDTVSPAFGTIHLGGTFLHRKSAYPVPCYMTGWSEKQVSNSPSGAAGPHFDVSMSFEEALI